MSQFNNSDDDALPVMHFRMDGSPYDGPFEEAMEAWGNDFMDFRGRIVGRDALWNGVLVSTVWIGLDSIFSLMPSLPGYSSKPLIYETLVRNELTSRDTIADKYATLDEAIIGHHEAVVYARGLWPTVRAWLWMILEEYAGEGMDFY